MCGRVACLPSSPTVAIEPDFSAIGLKSVPNTPTRTADPKHVILGALEEALMAALGSGVLSRDARDTAQTLLTRLGS
jgi:hypothetical protein